MPETLGPFISVQAILGNTAVSIAAIWFWFHGHIGWLILNNKKIPKWLLDSYIDQKNMSETKIQHVYLMKGLAWAIVLAWAWFRLIVSPLGDASLYKPVIGSITLLDIGGVVAEFVIFFSLTGVCRLLTWEKLA